MMTKLRKKDCALRKFQRNFTILLSRVVVPKTLFKHLDPEKLDAATKTAYWIR
jgi:hypothetical protein